MDKGQYLQPDTNSTSRFCAAAITMPPTVENSTSAKYSGKRMCFSCRYGSAINTAIAAMPSRMNRTICANWSLIHGGRRRSVIGLAQKATTVPALMAMPSRLSKTSGVYVPRRNDSPTSNTTIAVTESTSSGAMATKRMSDGSGG
jgi:hypothetical protein